MNARSWILCSLLLMLCAFSVSVSAKEGQEGGEDLMDLSLEDLLNMEVTTASKSSEKLADAAGVISVVSRDELQRFGGTTLADILNRVPGLSVSSTYLTDRTTLAARGDQIRMNSGHVLILIDGRPTREVVEGGINGDLLESFPVNVLERIEVIKGPGSVLYGSNAFSAVVNLITRKADQTGAVVTGLVGEKGAFDTSGSVMFRKGDLGIVGAARYSERPDWETTFRYRNPASGLVSDTVATIPNRGPGAFIRLNYRGFRFMTAMTEWETSYFIRGTVGRGNWNRRFVDVGYGFKVTNRWDMDLSLTYTDFGLDMNAFPSVKRDSDDLIAEWTNFFKLGEKSKLTFGSLYDYAIGQELYTGAPQPVTTSDDNRRSGAFYAQIDYWLHDKVKAIGGVQANKVENVDLDLVPRAGLIWKPSNNVNVKALFSQAFRAPSINETSLVHPTLTGYPGNTPENVDSFDLGINYFVPQGQIGVNYFHSKQSDIIAPVGAAPPRQYRNLGQVTFNGVEFEGKYYLNDRVMLLGSMLYQQNEDGNGIENVTPIANLGAKAGISFETERGLTLSLFDLYQGDLDNYSPGPNPAAGPYNIASLHSRLDLSKLFGAKDGGLSLIIQVDNLFDREVWLPAWGEAGGDSIPVNQGRIIYFGLQAALR